MADAQVYTDVTILVEHLNVDSTNTNKEGYVSDAALQAVSGNIQPSSAEVIALYGGAYGKSYTLFTTASGILETDRLTVSGTTQKYIVKGKQYYGYAYMQHGEYHLEQII